MEVSAAIKRRAAVVFFYDDRGIVDRYMLYLVSSLKEFCERIVFVSNGPLTAASEDKVRTLTPDVVVRKNEGFDVGGYKAGLDYLSYEALENYDELLLLNHTFYGPIFPFSETFGKMDGIACDFWGLSSHGEMETSFLGPGILPYHLNSHFIAVRQSILRSSEFRRYWDTLPTIETYEDSIGKHETKFTRYFEELGFVSHSLVDPKDYGTDYPVFMEVDKAIESRCPILKRRLFFHDPVFQDAWTINLPKALDIIERNSTYDTSLIWENVWRLGAPRVIATNSVSLSIFDETKAADDTPQSLRVAVCIHVYYTDDLPELMEYCKHIPVDYDVIATTDSGEKKALIEQVLADCKLPGAFDVRIVEQNRGRDTSAFLISCRDVFLADKYDAVCRLHTKRSPQVSPPLSREFKYHLLDNLLPSSSYVSEILSLFASNRRVGMAFPPVLHIGYPTLGHSWFANKPLVEKLAGVLDLHVHLDDHTPLAAYGSMFWFRPAALRKLFSHDWTWEDFAAEPDYGDGDLPHALERLIGYVCIDAGYSIQQIFTAKNAARNYAMLEYKHQKIMAQLPAASFVETVNLIQANNGVNVSLFRFLFISLRRSIRRHFPFVASLLAPPYRALMFWLRQR